MRVAFGRSLLLVLGAVLFIVFSATSPAGAQEGPNRLDNGDWASPGPIMRLNLAHDVFAIGQRRGDPILVIAAARLAAAVPVGPPEGAGEATDATGSAADPPDLEDMLVAGRTLADGEPVLTAMLDDVEATRTRGRLRGAASVMGSVAAGQSRIYDGDDTVFEGGADAEIAIQGNGDSDLDLIVTDELGNEICTSAGPADREYCRWRPRWTGPFRIEVRNLGPLSSRFLLTTN